MIKRRHLLIALVGVIACASTVRAQTPARIPRIGFLSALSSSETAPWGKAFEGGLRELGWLEGRNIGIEYRYADGKHDRIPDLAADLVRSRVDVILASAAPEVLAARNATRAIPIVMAIVGNPVASGLIESLARPGGNVTGLSTMSIDLAGKRLELLREMIPKLSRVAVLWNPLAPSAPLNWKEIQLPAKRLGLQLHSLEVRGPADLDKAFEDAARARAGAVFVIGDAMINTNTKRIADLAVRNRLPSMLQFSYFVDAGGLMAYGPDRADLYRRAAGYVDRILKGAKAADLPVEQPTKFELVINMKTARALGITIPQSILGRADRVIE